MSTPAAASVPENYHRFMGPLNFEPYARDITKRLAPRSGERILELATGTGIVTRSILAAMPKDASLVATDLTEGMLAIARAQFTSDPRITFQIADGCALPLPDRAFDAIVNQFGLMFFPDKIAAMREARRVLAPGGRYIFNVWDSLEFNPIPRTVHETLAARFPADPPPFLALKPFGYHNRAEIERVVRAGGFAKVTFETVTLPASAPTAEDVASAWIEGTSLQAAIKERGVPDPTPIRQSIAKILAERFGKSPCASTMQAIVVTVS